MAERKKTHVVVIGAGPAGLTAAYELLKDPSKYRVTILEEDTRVGGISKTVRFKGNRIDLGGHRFFSKDPRVTAWWDEILPAQGEPAYDDKILRRKCRLSAGGPDPEREDLVMLNRRRISRIYFEGHFYDYPLSLKWSVFQNMGLWTSLRAVSSFFASQIRKLPEDSLENFYINRFGRVLYSMFFESYTQKVWGRHPREISADWGAQRVKGLSVLALIKNVVSRLLPKRNRAVETSLIEEFAYPKFGPGQLWETVLSRIEQRGGVIRLGVKVTGFARENDTVKAVLCGGEAIEGDLFLSSMPLRQLVGGMPDVPEPVRRVADGLPYRDFVTVGLLLERLKLRNQTRIPTLGGIVPDCWIYIQDRGVKLGRVQIFNNWSPYMVADPDRTVWIGLEYFCDEHDEFWELAEQDCVAFAIGELIKIGVIEPGAAVLESCRERVQKAYPAYFDTYGEIDRVINYLDGIKNLYCIGRNGQHRYNNMDHSMATAFEAVKHIRGESADRSEIWNVNTEQAYHEKKA